MMCERDSKLVSMDLQILIGIYLGSSGVAITGGR